MPAKAVAAAGTPGSTVGYWKFDEGQGQTTYDTSVNVNNAQLGATSGSETSDPSWSNSGKFGRSLSFDGGDYLKVSANSSLDVTSSGNVTLSAWIKTSDVSSSPIIVQRFHNTGSVPYYRLKLDSNGKAVMAIRGVSGGEPTVTSNTSVNDNSWHYVAGTRNTTDGKIYIFVDGKLENSATDSSSGNLAMGGKLYIGVHGMDDWVSGNYFSGLIDEVKVYNSALTPDQVALDMNQGKVLQLGGQVSATGATGQAAEYCVPGDTTSCAGPMGEWKFDEKTGGSVNDVSGNGNTGTWNGTGTHWARGQYGSAGNFNGSDDSVSVASSGTIPYGSSARAVSMWIYTTASTWVADVNNPFHYGSNATRRSFGIDMDAYPNISVWTYGDDLLVDTGMPEQGWFNVAVTYDGSTSLKVYINGVLKGSKTLGGVLDTATSTMYIGSAFGVSRYNYLGKIDDVKIFNYARTPAQVAWDYNRGKPVGWWKMDEGEGGSAYDSSGNANTGTLTQMDPLNDWVDGKFGEALDFDGSNDLVDAGNGTSLNITGSLSIAAWVKASAFGGRTVAGKKYLGSDFESYELQVGGTNQFWFSGSNNGSSMHISTGGAAGKQTGVWYHVVGVYNGSNAKLYVNGVLEATDSGVDSSITATDGHFYLGYGYYNRYFPGQIDDVRVYNYALTQEQVRQVMNEGSAVRFGE